MAEPKYDLAAMLRAIEQCDKNVQVFEAEIAKQRETKKLYQGIVKRLEEKLEEDRKAAIGVV